MRFASRSFAVILACVALCSCKSVPATTVTTPPPAPALPIDTRVSWILRLEQQRILRDPDVAVPLTSPGAGRAISPARTADLTALVTDTDATVRRRAALAIGRVASAEGI